MYSDLFTLVIGRLRDTISKVRKQALLLFKDMVDVYALIFAKVNQGASFISMDVVVTQYQQFENDYNASVEVFETQK